MTMQAMGWEQPNNRYGLGYAADLNLRGYAPPTTHENGSAENGFRNGFGLGTPGPSVFEVLEDAETALRKKVVEVKQFQALLQESRQETEMLRAELAKAAPREKEGEERNRPETPSSNVPPIQPQPTTAPQAATTADSQVPSNRQDASSPSPKAASPSRQNVDSEDSQNMMLASASLRDRLNANLKEMQMLREIRSLEWRLSELRVAFDQQQQTLAEATTKALTYRQDLIDENLKLTYDLQVLEQERSVYVSSLLPLLADFGLQPPATDAQSVVSSIKALVNHLHDKSNERRSYQRPWHLYSASPPGPTQSPSSNGRGLELVPQVVFPQSQRPASPPSPLNVNNVRATGVRDMLHPESQEMVIHNHLDEQTLVPAGHDNNYAMEDGEGPISANRFDRGDHPRRSPHLPSLPEEANRTDSEDDEPLPAVAGLRIVGDAVLGGKLTVCGHSLNGTALCNFQWNRYYPDGSMVDIDGASRTEYIVSADDCDTLIAIQCCPMDEKGRKGEQVTDFANGQNPIKCDATMEDQINSHVAAGHAHFDIHVLLEARDTEDNWEAGSLILKRGSYEIRRNNVRVIREQYAENVNVQVVLGREIAGQFVLSNEIQCLITSSDSTSHYLAFRDNRVRDRAVLTLKRFRDEALKGRKGKKNWFRK